MKLVSGSRFEIFTAAIAAIGFLLGGSWRGFAAWALIALISALVAIENALRAIGSEPTHITFNTKGEK